MDDMKTHSTPLTRANLGAIRADVSRPKYDAADLSAGIVHIGLGNFHRGHQAWYLHRLMQQGEAYDWAIVGAGVRAADGAQRDRLLAQDCLTTLIELDPKGKSAEITGSMIDFLPVAADNAPLITAMADPAIKIVSLTVTEGGYFIDPATGGFDATHPDIQHDAANPATPRTAFGAMIAALKLRRDAGTGPFTGLSCDNVQGNGTVLRQTIITLANMSDPDLAAWIDEHCTFPNSMVDCIVPATGPAELALVQTFGIDDQAPVTHENFRQWVIEDNFCAGRPEWENVGATLTDDVHSFELMKLRILNAGHQIIAAPADLIGIETIAGAMAHTGIADLLDAIMRREVTPLVADVPGTKPLDYLALVCSRFSNPEIHDTTRRVAFDGSSRQPGFVLPTAREAVEAGTPVSGLALTSAIWARYCAGTRENGSTIDANDPQWAILVETAKAAQHAPSLWLEQRNIYGDLADSPAFADAFARWLSEIYASGVEAAISQYIAQA
ncbi:mannitol dehydrogenase family protein [Nereida sp. MMG025]|uniref:mannitol dehydrogenase family protein n=1 Tax=Nereida sp. MMG025 TaxID=2909981 RepID=UPI001F19121B|nr:mannitol dehydrogenase family protein [Nereida sp. MMG025]MCF6445584.1 mannitol dehydrogenase family protein [Nereida sp. MMG025]